MKTIPLLFMVISLLLFPGCSDNSSIVDNYNLPCPGDEDVLSQPGSPDAPVLYFQDETEYYDACLYWTCIDGAFYEVQECGCQYFSSFIHTYSAYTNEFYEVKNGCYYRVRALTNGVLTGWSNVVAASFPGRL